MTVIDSLSLEALADKVSAVAMYHDDSDWSAELNRRTRQFVNGLYQQASRLRGEADDYIGEESPAKKIKRRNRGGQKKGNVK